MKRAVITGSAGFLGSNLTKKCLDMGWEVYGIDNFSGSERKMASPERYNNNPRYNFNEADILNTKLLIDIFRGADTIFHLAALPRVQFSTDYPIEANNANINGTLSVLEAARHARVKRVVYSASSSMYGGQNIPFPTPETVPAHPRSNYALQKYVGSEYCRLYSELYGIETCSLIYFNLYGPLQQTGPNAAYNTVISAFMQNAIDGKSCRIDGEGDQSRDYTYVSDIVTANIMASEHIAPLLGDKFNIAGGNSYSVIDMYDKINVLSGGSLEKHYVPRRLGDPMKSQADTSKAKRILEYETKVDINEGLRLTFDWWKEGCQI